MSKELIKSLVKEGLVSERVVEMGEVPDSVAKIDANQGQNLASGDALIQKAPDAKEPAWVDKDNTGGKTGATSASDATKAQNIQQPDRPDPKKLLFGAGVKAAEALESVMEAMMCPYNETETQPDGEGNEKIKSGLSSVREVKQMLESMITPDSAMPTKPDTSPVQPGTGSAQQAQGPGQNAPLPKEQTQA